MPEHVVELGRNNSLTLPEDLLAKMDLTPGDNLLLRLNDGLLEVRKLPMTAAENGKILDDATGKTIKINRD